MSDIAYEIEQGDATPVLEVLQNHRPIRPLLINPQYLKFNTVQNFVPELRMVDPATLWVDDKYQRNPTEKSTSLIKKILKSWSWEAFKPPIVTEYEGKLFVVDGQHTSIAAVTHPEINIIPVFVVNINSVEDAAKAFILHNTNRTTVNPIQLFKASLEAGDEEAISINMALQRSGVKLTTNAMLESKLGYCSCLGTLRSVFNKYGMMNLRITLDICIASKLAPIQAHYVHAISELMFGKEHRGKYDPQGIALTIRDYPYITLVAETETYSRTKNVKKQEAVVALVRKKYESMFGAPDDLTTSPG